MTLGQTRIERDGGTVRLVLTGEFDLSNVREVEAAAYEALEAGMTDLCIDVTGVRFMDSSMLNLLVELQRRLGHRRGTLSVHPNLQMSQLLELSGLADLFNLTVDDPPPG